MDILSKAGELAGQAATAATQWYRLDAEQRQLARLRAQALQARALIGEEMYRLWKTGTLPPSSLDEHFQAVEQIMRAIEAQRARVEELRLHFGGTPPPQPVTILDEQSGVRVIEQPPRAPVPELPAGAPAAPAALSEAPPVPCPQCGRPGPSGKAYCGYCGARLT